MAGSSLCARARYALGTIATSDSAADSSTESRTTLRHRHGWTNGSRKDDDISQASRGFTLEEKLQVGLITIDTFRIGAVEQLRKYAEIMSLPMAVVESAEEMKSAVQRLSHCRLLFIDTAGRTPRDAEQLDVLRSLLQAAQPDETHLVLSATTSVGSCQDAMHRYSVVQPNRMVLTKLDEVRGLGELFPMLRQATFR